MLSHNQKKTITAHLESCKAYRKADAGELLSNRADPKELSTSELAKLLWSCPDVIWPTQKPNQLTKASQVRFLLELD